MNALAEIITADKVPAVYEPYRQQLAEIKATSASFVFDVTDKKGNKAARSHIAKLRSSKAAVEKARTDAKAPILEAGKKLDVAAKEIIAEFDQMIDQHQKPLDEFDTSEKVRVAAIRTRIDEIAKRRDCLNHSSEDIETDIQRLEAMSIDDSYGEFRAEAANTREAALAAQRAQLPIAQKREVDAAELAALRKKLADEQAAAKAKADADARDKADADEREAALKRKAEKAEAEKKQAEEREAKAAADQKQRDKEAEKAAAAAVEAAVAAERQRVADEAKAETEAAAKAAADAEHRAKVRQAVLEAIAPYDANGLFDAIDRGAIPYVTLTY